MAVPSDGSYGIPEGLIFSFPVEIQNKEWKIVQGLDLDDFAKSKIKITTEELVAERDEALQVRNKIEIFVWLFRVLQIRSRFLLLNLNSLGFETSKSQTTVSILLTTFQACEAANI